MNRPSSLAPPAAVIPTTAILLLAAIGCGERAEVTGMVSDREGMPLPPGAVLEVFLEDVSRADAPALEVGRAGRADLGRPPFAFAVAYDPAAIDPDHAYALRARIVLDDEVLSTTDQIYPVLTRGHGDRAELLLVRAAGATAAGSGAMRGMFRYLADAALFSDCVTRRRFPVAMAEDYRALERAYLEARRVPGADLLATFAGRIEARPAMDGDRLVETVVVERFEGLWPGETCGNPGATEALEDTYWKLTRLGDRPVRVLDDRREPHLVLRSREGRVGGSGGCNRFEGGYEADGERLAFGDLAGTKMACPEVMEQEQAFLQALGAVARWRLDGQHLELLDDVGSRLLRLEARAFP